MTTNKKMDVRTVSDEEIQDLFEQSFREQVGSYNHIDEFEAKCVREIAKSSLRVELTIQGLAGCPTAEDFKKGKLKNVTNVTISREDKGSIKFYLKPQDTLYLNSTEYIIIYQSE